MDPEHSKATNTLSPFSRIEILMEEYRSLNALLLFRLTALDRRLPASVGFMAAAVAATISLPIDSRIAVLIMTPCAVLWMTRTTIQHAKAKEDHLRRIAEIERAINLLAGEDLLMFQSQHPNRARSVSGRSGRATIIATGAGALLMLFLCLVVFTAESGPIPFSMYGAYIGLVGFDIAVSLIRLSRYRYERPTNVFLGSR